jgi:hypothetical protein
MQVDQIRKVDAEEGDLEFGNETGNEEALATKQMLEDAARLRLFLGS